LNVHLTSPHQASSLTTEGLEIGEESEVGGLLAGTNNPLPTAPLSPPPPPPPFAYRALSSGPRSIFNTLPLHGVQSMISLHIRILASKFFFLNRIMGLECKGEKGITYNPKSAFAKSFTFCAAAAFDAKLISSIVTCPFRISFAIKCSAICLIVTLGSTPSPHSPFVKIYIL